YDGEGNRVKKTKGMNAETWTYGYDHRNKLIWAEQRATDGGALLQRVDFKYDVFGNRIEKDVTAGGTTTVSRFAYDGADVWADLDGNNRLKTRYLRGDLVDQVFARMPAAGAAGWYLTDHLGSVRDITDNVTGAVLDHRDYDAFGNL